MSRDGQIDDGDQGSFFGDEWVEFDSSNNKTGWIVSYADMMTIILTFMILLLSVSKIAHTKFDLMVEALTGRKVGNLQKVKKKIDQVVEKASLGGQVTTSIAEDGLKVQFANALLFRSGEAKLTEGGREVLKPITDHLVGSLEPAYGVAIEGYTDDVPIENERFSSNWELSTSRSIHVMKRLAAEGFDRRRMSVQGFADTRSATDVDLHDEAEVEELSEEELADVRAKNRRVVIRINRLDEEMLEDILSERPERLEKAGERGATDGESTTPTPMPSLGSDEGAGEEGAGDGGGTGIEMIDDGDDGESGEEAR